MDAVEKVGKSYVATEKALDGISKQSEATFQEAVEKQSPVDTDKEIKFVDVTHKLFEKPVIDEFPQSLYWMWLFVLTFSCASHRIGCRND